MNNRFITFDACMPRGVITADDLHIAESERPTVADGEVLLHPVAIVMDPFQRNLLSGEPHHALPIHIPGQPIAGFAVAQVVESRHDDFSAGDLVEGWMDWADYAVWPNQNTYIGLKHLDDVIAKPSYALGVFGPIGLTAFYGITEVGQVQEGETVLISSAAGGVGSLAGQMAKIRGARVIGLTSSQAKRDVLTERLGFDLALDYREPDFADQLREAVPGGPDVYLDNVGGDLTTTIMRQMRRPARVIECGQLANYDDSAKAWTVDTDPIHTNGLRYEGYQPGLFRDDWPKAVAQIQQWVDEGRLIPLETEMKGLESTPEAMAGMFSGQYIGKIVVTADMTLQDPV